MTFLPRASTAGAIVDDVGFDQPVYSSDDYVPAGTHLPAEGDVSSGSARPEMTCGSTRPRVDGDLNIGDARNLCRRRPAVIDVRGNGPRGRRPSQLISHRAGCVVRRTHRAVLSFVAKNAPEGTRLSAATISRGRGVSTTWCDGSGECVNGIADFASYPPVSKFIEFPGGSLIELEGPVTSMKAQFRTMDGDRASDTFEDPIVLVAPTEPGRHALEVHVTLDGDSGAHGSATFWFGVEVVVTEDGAIPSAALDGAPSTGEIRCLTDGSTVVTTPQVAARADGIHIELREASGATGVELFKALSNGVYGTGWGPGQHPEVILPVPIGRSRIACAWPDGDDPTSRDELAASQPIEFVDPGGFYHLDELPCDYEERTYPDDPAYGAYVESNDQVAMPEVIRRAIPGILPTDVMQCARVSGSRGRLQTVGGHAREGELVALVRPPTPSGRLAVRALGDVRRCRDRNR